VWPDRRGRRRRGFPRRRHEREQLQRHWADRVRDIVLASKECIDFTAGLTLEQYQQDTKTHKAVLMNLVIIGEAAKYTPARVSRQHPSIPWGDLRELRNFVVHVYFRVEPRLVWETVHRELPAVVRRLEDLLRESAAG
jgi:uncharacterized protein with HEPN domain